MKQAKFIFIAQDIMLTKWMQAADLFDKSRVITTEAQTLTVDFDEREEIDLSKGEQILNVLSSKFNEAIKTEKLVLLHLISVQNNNVVYLNNKVKPFIDKSVRELSNGNIWGMFDDFLKNLNLKVETDKYRFIKNVEFETI